MLNTIYLIKTCMLIMYARMTTGLKQHKAVMAIAVWVACGWFATQFAFFFACRPFYDRWAVPPADPECTTFEKYAITQAVFNISSDLMMLGIMLPVLVKANLMLKQKLALVVIFGMGSFVIAAAILTKVFNLTDVYSTVYMLWYFREASTAIYVSNLPLIWPLLREWLTSFRRMSARRNETHASASNGNGTARPGGKGGISASAHPLTHMSKGSIRHHHHTRFTETDIKHSESAERINRLPFQGRGIFSETTVEVVYDEDEDEDEDDDASNRNLAPSSGRPPPTFSSSPSNDASDPANFDVERNAPLRALQCLPPRALSR